MIKITSAKYISDYKIEFIFSTKESGIVDLEYLIRKDTVMTVPLKDRDFFKDFFIELGAICWKNGLELSPNSIYQRVLSQTSLQSA